MSLLVAGEATVSAAPTMIETGWVTFSSASGAKACTIAGAIRNTAPTPATVSYTHLTLPTKRIV